MCESTCDTLTSSAANQGDNTVSVAQSYILLDCKYALKHTHTETQSMTDTLTQRYT